jgi:predicted DNA-binding ribbon-helix-helix protein
MFLNTSINLDNNSLEIIKMLHENDSITSNEIVARLVDNGLSYDYASKVKNKIIESLNEKFEFITWLNDSIY